MSNYSAEIFSESFLELIQELGPVDSKTDVLKLSTKLRSTGLSPDTVTNAISQARLRHRAITKFGEEQASTMLFTEPGLEQASRLDVSNWHAKKFAEAGISSVTDLGCGIGADAMAFANSGIAVTAVEVDSETAAIARFNLKGFSGASVIEAAAEKAPLATDGYFLDPARRKLDRKGANRVMLSPEDFSPSLDFAFDLGGKFPTAVKLAGSFPHELIPDNCEANWVSHNNELVETILFFGSLGQPGKRAAVLLEKETLEFSGSDAPADISELGNYIYDPNSALVRSHLIGDFAREHGLTGIAKSIAFLSSNTALSSPWLRGFQVLEVLSMDPKKISKRLQELGIGVLEIKKRGVDTTPEELRKKLKLKGSSAATLILTKVGDARKAILCQPIS